MKQKKVLSYLTVSKLDKLLTKELYLVLKTQMAEYQRQPLLNLGFILSLAIATSTLLSILMLNDASKQQYMQANSLLKNPVAYHIVAKPGSMLNKHDYVNLRKQGFTQISPVLAFRKTLNNGKRLSFKAIDMLALSVLQQQEFNIGTILLTQNYLDTLSVDNKSLANKQIQLVDKKLIPFSVSKLEQLNNVALLDLTLAWRLFPEEGDYSHLLVAQLNVEAKLSLELALPDHLTFFEPWSVEERSGFADALHLNLNALALLGFIVCMFIAFQAANQAWQKRAKLAAQLRLLGVQLFTIKVSLFLETLFLVLTAGMLGILIALLLVSFLLPLMGLTLQQLYALNSSEHFQWQWQYLLWALAISGFAVILALIKQFKIIATKHIALSARGSRERFSRWQTILVLLIFTLLFLLCPSENWLEIMFKYACLLMASVAVLPHFLQFFIFSGGYLFRFFRINYMFKDASKQIIRRYLPLAAFYLAMTASVSAALMVNSFESAFINYLEQQLNADIFIRHKPWQKNSIENFLEKQTEVDTYFIRQRTWAKVDNESIRLSSYQSTRQLDALLFKSFTSDSDEACYINEQLALKHGHALGQRLLFAQDQQFYECNINGIYYEYGYPGFSAMVPYNDTKNILSGWFDGGFSIFFKPDVLITKQHILTTLALDEQQIYSSKQIKKLALNIFSQTFVLIEAIAALLLSIACLGLFLSANGLELARKSDLYILCSLGYSKWELFIHMLMQWLLLVIGVIVMSWPMAMILANTLVNQVLPVSFGWSMPLILNVSPFALSSVLGLLFLIPALSIPLYKLNVRENL